MSIPYGGVTGNEVSDEHLWSHGLEMTDAEEVWAGPAKYFPQPAQSKVDEYGREHQQPERMMMVGPDRNRRLLTFILELPDRNRTCHVVTGWPSKRGERTRYHQPGGRMRIR